MKILLVASGRSYHATRWANSLALSGFQVGFATGHRIERPLDSQVEVFTLSQRGKAGYLLNVPMLRALIDGWQPDLLHAHYATGYGLMSKLSGFSPRIVSVYGADIYDFPRRSWLHKKLLALLLDGAHILSTSESMADEYLRCFPEKPRPRVTPFGVDLDVFRPGQKESGVRGGSLNIGIVKKLEHKYGLDVLLQAFALVLGHESFRTAKLHIVGTGSRRPELEKLTEKLDLTRSVSFHGAMPNSDVPAFLNSCDFFVVPSRLDSESFGVAAVEAMACGLPVIASDVGGLPEVVKHDVTGLIVPKEDVAALAGAIIQLATDSDLRQRYGEAARRRVEHLYDWNRNVGQMIEVYRTTIGR